MKKIVKESWFKNYKRKELIEDLAQAENWTNELIDENDKLVKENIELKGIIKYLERGKNEN